jgi:CSLREA domain-containing protein
VSGRYSPALVCCFKEETCVSQRSFKRAHARRLAKERRRASTLKRRGGVLVSVLGATTVFAASAQAATFQVNTSADDASGGTCAVTCTLRDAVTSANADGSANTITFASGVSGPITLANGSLPISDAGGLTITGPGSGALTVSGNGASQIFSVSTANPVSITGLTLTGGSSATDGGAIGVTNSAPLSLSGDTISASTTTTGRGGGVSSAGPITISNSVISGNTAPTGPGGGIEESSGAAKVTVTGSTITGNTGQNGGGIAGGEEIITASQITNNHANATTGYGGGLDPSEVLNLQGSTVSGNTSTGTGGGIYESPKYGSTISGSTISGNTASDGGGLTVEAYSNRSAHVQVLNTTVSGNHATRGAGVEISTVKDAGQVTIQGSTISGNQGGASSFGGGVLIAGPVYSSVQLLDSTVSGNAATSGAGISLGGASSTATVLGTNADGSKGSITLGNSTIAANAASSAGGGIYLSDYSAGSPATEQSGTASLESTIVAGNTAAGAAQDLARAAGSTNGGFTAAFSLIQTPGTAPLTGTSVIAGVSPQLGALASNGGPTQTMLPSGTSPVIDQGHAPDSLTQDQRGNARTVETAIPNPPGGDGTDIGAVELPASSVVIPPTPTPTAGFSVSIRGTALGGAATPLLIADSTPVTCSVKSGTLASCVIQVVAKGKLLASGAAIATKATTQLVAEVTPTAAGRSLLAHNPLGVTASAQAVASATGSPSVSGNVHLLASPSVTVPLGKRSAKLSKSVTKELDQLAKLITAAKTVTCTAYSDKGKHDTSLTSSQAKAACARLRHDGLKGKFRIVGKGHANPVASNKTKKGRAANRRVVVSFSF